MLRRRRERRDQEEVAMAGLTEETDLMDSFEDMHPRDDEAIQDPLKRDNLRAIDVEQYTG